MVAVDARQYGFTVLELVVTMGVMALLLAIGLPSFSQFNGQLQASDAARQLAQDLSEIRSEAIRLRSSVQITFTSDGYAWDIDADGSTDGSREFSSSTGWSGATPNPILLNGLGLARGISGSQTLTVINSGIKTSVTINHNGHIKL